jgi:nucleoid DNA-binding protein
MSDKQTYDRRIFIDRFMHDGNLNYSDACRIYDIMCQTVSDAITSGNKVTFGRVGALKPTWRAPREVRMHFRVKPGKTIEKGVHRTFYMDGRLDYRFKLYKQFVSTHKLNWFATL